MTPHLARDRAAGLLGDDLGRAPRDRHREHLPAAPALQRGGDAEVGEHRGAEGRDEDVAGLDVAVDEPGAMRRLECARHAHPDREHLLDGDALHPVALRERARAVLHHDVRAPVGRDARLVDRHDRGMRRKVRQHVGLGVEHAPQLGVAHVAGHDLDRHIAAGHVLLVQEDVGESAGAERADIGQPGKDRGRRGKPCGHHTSPAVRYLDTTRAALAATNLAMLTKPLLSTRREPVCGIRRGQASPAGFQVGVRKRCVCGRGGCAKEVGVRSRARHPTRRAEASVTGAPPSPTRLFARDTDRDDTTKPRPRPGTTSLTAKSGPSPDTPGRGIRHRRAAVTHPTFRTRHRPRR